MAEPALATFGGGCFWCIEAVFERLKGVETVTSGYSAGSVENPSYKQVCGGGTGHAEVVQVKFDPSVISYDDLLDVFFEAHDPTTMNRQGADIGTQYRSIVLFHDDAQRLAAEHAKSATQEHLGSPVVTEVVPLKQFWPAEDYHQDYFVNNPAAPYCQAVIGPKLRKLQTKITEYR